jgi:hypothetical protein
MYDRLSPAGREFRIDRNWGHLLKAVHEAASAAFPDLMPENWNLRFR